MTTATSESSAWLLGARRKSAASATMMTGGRREGVENGPFNGQGSSRSGVTGRQGRAPQSQEQIASPAPDNLGLEP